MRKMVELMDEQSAEQEEVMSSIRSASGSKSARAHGSEYSTATTASVASAAVGSGSPAERGRVAGPVEVVALADAGADAAAA